MTDDETVPIGFAPMMGANDMFPTGFRPNIRTVDIGVDVIDLAKMREEFEASRTKKAGG